MRAQKPSKEAVKFADGDLSSSSIAEDFNKIQTAAAKLVEIQEIAKQKGSFSAEDNERYALSLYELGQSAQKLAQLQQSGQIKDFSHLIQHEMMLPQNLAGTQKDEESYRPNPEDDLLPPNTEDPYEDVNDSVAINLPRKDASIAEAKPEGLSIAGVGGVASSKPNAVALSGLNGLAVASPKATAISGVSAEEAAAYSISLPSRNHLIIKSAQMKKMNTSQNETSYDYVDLDDGRTVTGNRIPLESLPNDVLIQKWKLLLAANRASAMRAMSFNTASKDAN